MSFFSFMVTDTAPGWLGPALFSICEEPFLSSGDQCLGFVWRGDSLYAKRAAVPASTSAEERKWTTFDLALREPMAMPALNAFSKFLATCLTFTEHLREIDAYFGEQHVVSLSKTASPELPLDVPPETVRESPRGLFALNSVELRNVQVRPVCRE